MLRDGERNFFPLTCTHSLGAGDVQVATLVAGTGACAVVEPDHVHVPGGGLPLHLRQARCGRLSADDIEQEAAESQAALPFAQERAVQMQVLHPVPGRQLRSARRVADDAAWGVLSNEATQPWTLDLEQQAPQAILDSGCRRPRPLIRRVLGHEDDQVREVLGAGAADPGLSSHRRSHPGVRPGRRSGWSPSRRGSGPGSLRGSSTRCRRSSP